MRLNFATSPPLKDLLRKPHLLNQEENGNIGTCAEALISENNAGDNLPPFIHKLFSKLLLDYCSNSAMGKRGLLVIGVAA
jgi:hypothetical protein